MKKTAGLIALLALLLAHVASAATDFSRLPVMSGDAAGKLVLVSNGVSRMPIVLPPDPAPFILEAARELTNNIGEISGAEPVIMTGIPAPLPASAVYVGYQPLLTNIFPSVDFNFKHPEEILIVADQNNLAICGRDRHIAVPAETAKAREMTAEHNGYALDPEHGRVWSEAGTSCAVYTFIERCLNVRWLWEGPVGTDIVKSTTISLPAFEYRHYPMFRKRHLWPRYMKDWYRRQRIWYYSHHWTPGHSFTDWWDKYHEAHPEYFAMNADGTRQPPFWGPRPYPPGVKLCVSNPDVRAQILANVEEELRINPLLEVVRAFPNDGPGFCTCDRCKAMDAPGATGRGRYSDRYAKFWNLLAHDLKARFPERDLLVGGGAYSVFSEPPRETKLASNVVVSFVGFFPNQGLAETRRQQDQWRAWAENARYMFYRPNLFKKPSRGGLELDRTIQAFDFLAANRCAGIVVDTLPNNWALQGPQYYLVAQLMYDPSRDGRAVLQDYFRRAFGPAAGEVEAYFRLLETTHYGFLDAVADFKGNNEWDVPRDEIALKMRELNDRAWNDQGMLARAGEQLDSARAKLDGADELYRKRLEFVRVGFDYLRLSAEIDRAMEQLQAEKFSNPDRIRQALRLFEQRQALHAAAWSRDRIHLRYSLSKVDLEIPGQLRTPEYARMQYLAQSNLNAELIAEYGQTDLGKWPTNIYHHAFMLRADAARAAGKTQMAIDDYTRCVDGINPDDQDWARAVNALMDCHAKLGNFDAALGLYRRALPRYESSAQAGSALYASFLENAGRMLYKQGQPDEALELLNARLETLIKWQTQKFNILELMGDMLAEKGDRAAAGARYQQALDMYKGRTGEFYERRISRVKGKLEKPDDHAAGDKVK